MGLAARQLEYLERAANGGECARHMIVPPGSATGADGNGGRIHHHWQRVPGIPIAGLPDPSVDGSVAQAP